MQFVVRAVGAALAAAVLVSCGGGDSPTPVAAADPAATLRAAALPAPQPHMLAATTAALDPDSFMDWAETRFPTLFTSHVGTRTLSPYMYRAYDNGLYLVVDTQAQGVYVIVGDRVVPVGHLADFGGAPVLSGVAAKGLLAGASLSVYTLNANGSKGSLLASTTTGADGSFSVRLPWQSTGPVLLEATGGSYTSAYDGKTVSSQAAMQAMLASVSLSGETGISVNPLSDMSAALTRSYLASGSSLSSSLATADQWVAWQYGLKSAPARIVPKFDVTAVSTDAQSVHLALILAGLDTLGKRLSPMDPDAIYATLTRDFADGKFDGKSGSTQLSLDGMAMPADAGTAQYAKAFAITFTGSASGLRPGYLDSNFQRGTVIEKYEAKLIPVYEASSLSSYFPPKYTSPIPESTTALDTSATGASCPAGAPLSYEGGQWVCGSYYYCTGGATLMMINGREACSDGGIPMFQSQTIATYTAQTIPVYTAASIPSYTATTPDCYLAQTTIGDPPAGTPAIFRAEAVHLLTRAELDAMAAADAAAGAAYAAKYSSLGVPNSDQLYWLQQINSAVIASVSH